MGKQTVLVGAGSFGREVLNWLRDSQPGTEVLGFLDDTGTGGGGLPCLGPVSDYRANPSHQLLVTIADPRGRSEVVGRLRERGAQFASFIHPSAVIASSARIGEGCILCPLSLVSVDAVIEPFVIVNVHSSVGHDVTVGAFSTLSSHVDLTGFARIGERVSIGSSACVLPKVTVAEDVTIGAGAVVVRAVPPGSTLYAQPAKRLR
jgi:sugar O-acyltransferase (sialic acid O-acetyltransferase NeuD family)